MMSNWSVYLLPPWSAAPPHPASPTFSPYLPRFSNLSIFSAAAAAAVCDCAPLRNRTEVGEREREIFGMAEEGGGGGGGGGEGGGGGGRGRGEFAAIIPHPPSITKRENRPLHSALLLPLSLLEKYSVRKMGIKFYFACTESTVHSQTGDIKEGQYG